MNVFLIYDSEKCSPFQIAQINTLKAKALQKGYALCKIIASFLHSEANEIDTDHYFYFADGPKNL